LDLGLVVRRHELTDEQWQAVEPLLPVVRANGRPRVDDRRVINGMLFKAKDRGRLARLPERYGPWKTVYNRFWRWTRNGTLSALVSKVRVIAEAIDELDRDLAREVSADSSIVRAHQHAAGARTDRRQAGTAATPPSSPGGGRVLDGQDEPGDHAIGRSRGGPPPRSTSPATGTAGRCRCC
jgi:transposase